MFDGSRNDKTSLIFIKKCCCFVFVVVVVDVVFLVYRGSRLTTWLSWLKPTTPLTTE
jgi:hypothetical protein